MHRWIGAEATSSIGLRPSQFQLTDNERLLRDLAYPLIEPPHSRPAWKSVFGNYQPLPAPWRQQVVFDRTAYGRLLIDEPHRSHSSRYAQLMDDVRDDITRFEPFFADAMRVLELDKKRNASLALVSGLSPREHADAIARMQENTLIVQWVQQCLEQRISSYRWALERLVIQAPDNIAADADRLIGVLRLGHEIEFDHLASGGAVVDGVIGDFIARVERHRRIGLADGDREFDRAAGQVVTANRDRERRIHERHRCVVRVR